MTHNWKPGDVAEYDGQAERVAELEVGLTDWRDECLRWRNEAGADRFDDLVKRADVAEAENARLRERLAMVEAAVERVRKRHPRGDEEASILAPGLWCPTCGRERGNNGYGACPDRAALAEPDAPEGSE